ncbi:hypothetical protein, partial [Pantoea agglomerans]|uniref:hypothetical protein n=1 Tax=Enterobacter agglomerans TaxID=549 RepID=UPI003BF4E30A
AGRAIPGANPPLRDIPVARPEIHHPLSGSDGLPTPSLLSFLFMLSDLSLWVLGLSLRSDHQTARQQRNEKIITGGRPPLDAPAARAT